MAGLSARKEWGAESVPTAKAPPSFGASARSCGMVGGAVHDLATSALCWSSFWTFSSIVGVEDMATGRDYDL